MVVNGDPLPHGRAAFAPPLKPKFILSLPTAPDSHQQTDLQVLHKYPQKLTNKQGHWDGRYARLAILHRQTLASQIPGSKQDNFRHTVGFAHVP
jgi:hypothetical protein